MEQTLWMFPVSDLKPAITTGHTDQGFNLLKTLSVEEKNKTMYKTTELHITIYLYQLPSMSCYSFIYNSLKNVPQTTIFQS